jgi:hypothetical protein
MVNDGIKDGIESTTRRPKPSQGIQSDPPHTDTLSVLTVSGGADQPGSESSVRRMSLSRSSRQGRLKVWS